MAGAFAVARLQNVEAVVFDRELEVLHVLEVLLEDARGLSSAPCAPPAFPSPDCAIGCGVRTPATDVFALGVDQIFAVENFLAGRRIARESNAGRARLAHVAEDHRLNVHRRAPIVRNAVFARDKRSRGRSSRSRKPRRSRPKAARSDPAETIFRCAR